MRNMERRHLLYVLLLGTVAAGPAAAASFVFNNGNVDGRMASASRPETAGNFEIESADDFVLADRTQVTTASFTGLLPAGTSLGSIGQVRAEIYRVFPNDSNVGRTSGPPTFSTAQVPTRVNSPSDVAFDSRDTADGTLNFTTAILSSSFNALNSLRPGGIHPSPGQTTGGNGPVTGQEVRFDVTFATPFDLPADHYFFVPQVALSGSDEFLWLSSVRPIVSPGTPFTPDLQAWARDQFLDPDWLRIGTDIVGGSPAPTFNLAFSLQGQTVPEPASLALFTGAIGAFAMLRRRRS
jgi:hypothetical protein